MKQFIVCSLLILLPFLVTGQKLAIEPSLGLGFPTSSKGGNTKIQAGLTLWTNPIDKLHLGVHLSTGGTIWNPDNNFSGIYQRRKDSGF